MAEDEAGIRELKTHLSAYLRRVKKGESIVITEYGKPIGQIVPVGVSAEKRLEQLVEGGVVSWTGKKLEAGKPAASVRGDTTVSELISEERDEAGS